MFVDAALVCTGRVPATKDMGLEENGIETFRGFVQVTSLFKAHRLLYHSTLGLRVIYRRREGIETFRGFDQAIPTPGLV